MSDAYFWEYKLYNLELNSQIEHDEFSIIPVENYNNIKDKLRKRHNHQIPSAYLLIKNKLSEQEAFKIVGDIYFNTKWEPPLRELRALNPNSPEAVSLFRNILKDVIKASLQPIRAEITENE